MKSQIYLCVDLKVYSRDSHMGIHEQRTGALTYLDADHFLFEESVPTRRHRNPKLYEGKHITLVKNAEGQYMLNLRRHQLTADTDLVKISREILSELKQAKKEAGV